MVHEKAKATWARVTWSVKWPQEERHLLKSMIKENKKVHSLAILSQEVEIWR